MHHHTSTVARDLKDIPLRSSLHAQFPTPVPQYICPQCEADIPLTHVITSEYTDRTSRPADRARPPKVRRVQVLCPCCKSAYESGQVWEMDFWRCAEIRRIFDTKEKQTLARKIADRCGIILRPAAA